MTSLIIISNYYNYYIKLQSTVLSISTAYSMGEMPGSHLAEAVLWLHWALKRSVLGPARAAGVAVPALRERAAYTVVFPADVA